MPLGMRQVQSSLLDDAPEGDYTSPPPTAGATEGLLSAIPRGLAEGETKIGGAIAEAASTALRESPALKLGVFSTASMFGGEAGQKLVEETDDERDARIRKSAQDALDAIKGNPHTTGTAAQVLTGLSGGLTELVGGGPALVGAAEGSAARREAMTTQGVDKATADRLGEATALFAAAGAALPGGFGKTLLQRILSGSAAQGAMGVASRASSSAILEDAGYHQQASQVRALDAQAILADTVLGAGFGALHHVFTPSVEDAARTTNDAVNVENHAPGVPIDPVSRNNHVDNMNAATKALIEETDLHDLKDVQTVPNEAAESLRAEVAGHIDEAGRELIGETAEPVVEQNRRADDVAAARMAELRTLGDKRTPEESVEYTKLLEEDRLAAKVGGRRIQGLLSREALEERIAAGQGFSHYAYFDLDMFKDINDTFGMHHGDEAIRAAGESAAQIAGVGAAFKGSERAGDEFVIGGDSPEDLQSKIEAIRQHLSNHTIELYKDGVLVKSRKGLDFSHGIGESVDEAAAASKVAKQERARLGLRADRGAVPETVSGEVRPGGGETSAGAKAGTQVTSDVDATSKLTKALRKLAANRSDQNAHSEVRDILEASKQAGHDTAAIESAAITRAGEGAKESLAAAKGAERVVADTSSLDPETREAVDAAQSALDRAGELTVEDPATGQQVSAREALAAAMDRLKNSDALASVHEVAAACFGRG